MPICRPSSTPLMPRSTRSSRTMKRLRQLLQIKRPRNRKSPLLPHIQAGGTVNDALEISSLMGADHHQRPVHGCTCPMRRILPPTACWKLCSDSKHSGSEYGSQGIFARVIFPEPKNSSWLSRCHGRRRIRCLSGTRGIHADLLSSISNGYVPTGTLGSQMSEQQHLYSLRANKARNGRKNRYTS